LTAGGSKPTTHERPSEVGPRYPDLAGRVAIVTRANTGLDCGIAGVLGRERMKLVLAARSTELGEVFTVQLRRKGVEAAWVTNEVLRSGECGTRSGGRGSGKEDCRTLPIRYP